MAASFAVSTNELEMISSLVAGRQSQHMERCGRASMTCAEPLSVEAKRRSGLSGVLIRSAPRCLAAVSQGELRLSPKFWLRPKPSRGRARALYCVLVLFARVRCVLFRTHSLSAHGAALHVAAAARAMAFSKEEKAGCNYA